MMNKAWPEGPSHEVILAVCITHLVLQYVGILGVHVLESVVSR
jgi:hypothetical protein